MANIECLVPFIFEWEGGFVNDPYDRGGATNMGVTLETWKNIGYDKNCDGIIDINDLRLLTKEDVVNYVLKPHYWDRWRADEIRHQQIANILVDWVWASGKWGIIIPQRILGLTQDGVVGPQTLAAVNSAEPIELFARLKDERLKFVDNIIARDSTQKRFEKGWKNRINSL